MTKVLVYGGEESVERTTSLLEKEIPTEIEAIVARRDYSEMNAAGIMEGTERDLFPRMGNDKLIVLADVSVAAIIGTEMHNRYPAQRLVWYGQSLVRVIRKLKRAYILVSLKIRRRETYQRMKAACQGTDLIESDDDGWLELIRKKRIDKMEITEQVKTARGAPIVVLHPDIPIWKMKEIVDWRNEIVDLEAELLESVKGELGLKYI